jgi:hypothetical protein
MSENIENLAHEDTQSPMSVNIDRRSTLVGGLVLVALIVIAFVGYTIHRRDTLAAQARAFGRIFIENSPVVETQLGEVRTLKAVQEQHRTGRARGWYLDYDVTGQQKTGVVDMRLTPNPNYGQWNVPLAELRIDHHKPVNLR